jgi:hypothetical protein
MTWVEMQLQLHKAERDSSLLQTFTRCGSRISKMHYVIVIIITGFSTAFIGVQSTQHTKG